MMSLPATRGQWTVKDVICRVVCHPALPPRPDATPVAPAVVVITPADVHPACMAMKPALGLTPNSV